MHKKKWIRINSVILAAIMACSVALSQPVYATEADTQNAQEVNEEQSDSNENESVSDSLQTDIDDNSSELTSADQDNAEEQSIDGESEDSASDQEESEETNEETGEETNGESSEEAGEETNGESSEKASEEEGETDYSEDGSSMPDDAAEAEEGKSVEDSAPEKREMLTLTADDFSEISSYEAFIEQLPILEGYAQEYAAENTKEEANSLVINFIRTGVTRYNSDSWAIIAGSEKTEFVDYVLAKDSELGTQASSLRKLNTFYLPNGDIVDFGHMFGTMDIISYKGDIHSDTADMGGWAGDICDLASYSKNHGVSAVDVDGMADEIRENYLHVDVEDEHAFGDEDIHGDLDGYYLMSELQKGSNTLSSIMSGYFTENLTEADRAVYFLSNHFAGQNTKDTVRAAIYDTYKNNSGIIMLEADRGLSEDKDITTACSYAFADYLYELAKDEIGGEDPENPNPDDPVNPDPVLDNEYYSVFSSKSSTLAPGVTQEIKYATTADNKQLAYYLAYADVGRDDVNVYANYNNNTADTWKMARVSDQMEAARARHTNPDDPEHFIEDYTPVVGINGDFYNMSTGVPSGALVMEGVIYHEVGNENFFGILKDGTPIIGGASEWAAYKNDLQEAVGAGSTLVRDGKSVISKNDNYTNARASRTCVGITGDGRVVFMVLDGRQEPFSAGGSAQEIAQIMVDAGCEIAVNLDGGGSTTFVAKQEGADSPTVVNRPSDGYERSVSSSLMIVSGAKPSNIFDHAIITSDQDYVTKGTSLTLSVSGVSVSGGSAEVPEGAVLRLTDESIGTLEDNVFTAAASGETEVQLVIGEEIAAAKTIHVVAPDVIAFERNKLSAIYGVDVPLPLKAYYEGKEVAISPEDVLLQLSDESAGTINGFMFNGNEDSNIRVVKVTALLWEDFDIQATAQITLYKNGEAVFDFNNATVTLDDGDFGYNRDVPNAVMQHHDELGTIYHLDDPKKPLDVSYVFAIDMKGIKIPEKLAPMIALLPGGDTVDATPWNFMLQLAERVGTLSEVKVDFKVDPNMNIDYSNLTFANEYFKMDTVEFDEDTNTLSIICHWIDQTQAIDPATANPMCILSGITLTPKEDAPWDKDNYLRVKNVGTISYDVYLRSSTLYSVASSPSIQEEYGIYPYRCQDILYNGAPEAGGHFGQQYLAFDDEYVLDNTVLDGWVVIADNLYYFEDNTMLTGIHEVPGYNDEDNMYYYSFDNDGVCIEKVSGLFELDGDKYFAKNGVLQSGWQSLSNGGSDIDYYYFDKTTHKAVDGEQEIDGYHYRFEDCILVRGELVTRPNGEIWYRWAGDWASQQWYDVDGDKYYFRSNYAAAVNLRAFNIDNVNVFYVFSEDGVWQENVSGLYDTPDGNTYLVENGIVVNYPGLVKIGDDYYYFGYVQPYAAYKNAKRWIDKTNGLLPAGTYQFDEKGRIVNPPVPVKKYEVTFDANGGQGSMSAQSFEEGKEGVLKAVEFTREGYTFTGWNTESDGSGDSYSNRQKVSLTSDLTLYAVWEINSFTITWQNEDGTELSTDKVDYGVVPEYSGEKPVKEMDERYMYVFTGWTPEVTAAIEDATYTAKYNQTDRMYKVIWKNDDNTTIKADAYKYGEMPVFQGTPEKPAGLHVRYVFTGWSPEVAEVTKDAEYMAVFEVKGEEHTVSFDANGGSGEMPAQTFEYGKEISLSPNSFTNDSGKFIGWNIESDGSGTSYEDEAVIDDLTEDITLYAQWKKIGWDTDENGRTWYNDDGDQVHFDEWASIDGKDYFFKSDGYVATDLYETTAKDDESHKAVFVFDHETGEFLADQNGLYDVNEDTYWTENGEVVEYAGLVRTVKDDGEVNYYYFGEDNKAVKNLPEGGQDQWISKEKANGLLPEWGYYIDEKGVLLHDEDTSKNGILDEEDGKYYYIDGIRVHMGLIKIGDDYYYVKSKGEVITGKSYYCTRMNEFEEEFPEGTYTFDEEGRMVFPEEKKDGIYEEDGSLYYYEDGKRTYGGIMLIDGDYYYAATSGEVVHGRKYWISKTNGLLPEKSYEFAEDGKIIFPPAPKNGIYEEDGSLYYYVNDARTYGGVIEIDGDYYYAASSGEVVHSRKYWISKTNGLIPERSYTFDDQGRITDAPAKKDETVSGIVEEDGSLYYYENGLRTYGGVMLIDGNYYYAATSGEVVHGRKYWISKTNGLLKEKSYTFDDDGVMQVDEADVLN